MTHLAIWWLDRLSNENLWKETNQLPIHIEIRKRKWIGHTLRKLDGAIEKGAFQWNPQGERKIRLPRERLGEGR